MPYSLACECGNQIEVSAAQAGSEVTCTCGQVVNVPMLSALRKTAGKAAYESNTMDTINRMVQEGELPWGDTCAVSGYPTTDSCQLFVLCESKWLKGSSMGDWFILFFQLLILPVVICLDLFVDSDKASQSHGHDRGVYVPIIARTEHHAELKKMRNQAKLQEILRTVPIYAKLLDEFPNARISG
ncbi:MAG: hypothetical protein COA78_18705 [Blastopirellula sp.]|nr:MAG: hypothetical protein COA78_18705 [Blastopirellula sp.]